MNAFSPERIDLVARTIMAGAIDVVFTDEEWLIACANHPDIVEQYRSTARLVLAVVVMPLPERAGRTLQ